MTPLVPAVVLWTFLLCATTLSWPRVAAYTSPHCVNRSDGIWCQQRSSTVHKLDDYGRPSLQVHEVRATTTRTVLFLVDERRLLVAQDGPDGNTDINEAAQTANVSQDPVNLAAGTTPKKALDSDNIIPVGQPSVRPSMLPESSSSRLLVRLSSARSRLFNAIQSSPMKDILFLLYKGWTIYTTARWLWPIIQSGHIGSLSLNPFLPPTLMTKAKPRWDQWVLAKLFLTPLKTKAKSPLEVLYDIGAVVFVAHRTLVMVCQVITLLEGIEAWLREQQKQAEERQQDWEKRVWVGQQDWEKRLLERELNWEKQLQRREQDWEMGLHDPQWGWHLRLKVRYILWEKRLKNRQEDWKIRLDERYKDWEDRLQEKQLYWQSYSFLQMWEMLLEERQAYWKTRLQNRQQVWEKTVWKRQQDWEMEVQKRQRDWEKQDSEKWQQDSKKQKRLQKRKQNCEIWLLERVQDWKTRTQNRQQDWETRMHNRQQHWETRTQNRQQQWETRLQKRRQNGWLHDWDYDHEDWRKRNAESHEDWMKRYDERVEDRRIEERERSEDWTMLRRQDYSDWCLDWMK